MNVTSTGATPYYYRSGTLTTQAGSPVSVSYTLWAVGGMSLRWELLDGSVHKTCEQAGVTGVRINMRDRVTGKLVYGEEGDAKACTGAPILYKYLRPGDYDVIIKGMSGSQVTYSNLNNPPVLTVKALRPEGGSGLLHRQPPAPLLVHRDAEWGRAGATASALLLAGEGAVMGWHQT
ncbi:hypothetical protein ACN28S_44220 [Cystobacter fuscus]